jgi:hypothetical protein
LKVAEIVRATDKLSNIRTIRASMAHINQLEEQGN